MTNKEKLRKIAFYCNEYDPLRIYIGPTARSYEDKYENRSLTTAKDRLYESFLFEFIASSATLYSLMR